MKKLVVLMISISVLLLSLATATPAATNYVEVMTSSAQWDSKFGGDSKYEGDFKGIILGYDLPVNRFRFGLEYLDADYEWDDDWDISGYELKFGYRIFQSVPYEWVLNLSYTKYESDLWRLKYDGLCLGASFYYDIRDRINLETAVSYSLNGTMKSSKKDWDANHLAAKIKLNYYLNNDFGLALAYRLYQYEFRDSHYKLNAKGLTVGVNHRF